MKIDEFLKAAMDSIDADSKYAENKNTFLITFNAAIIGLIVALKTSSKSISCFENSIVFVFSIIIFIASLVSLISILPLNPLRNRIIKKRSDDRKNEGSKYMFYDYVSSHYCDGADSYIDFENDLKEEFEITEEFNEIEKQLCKQIVDLAIVGAVKFKLFRFALIIEMIAFVVFIPFLISVFV